MSVVRVFPDHSSNGIWDERGLHMSYEDLPVSKGVIIELQKMCQLYEKYDKSYLGEMYTPINFTILSFNTALLIKNELPHWTVIFFKDRDEDLKIDKEPWVFNGKSTEYFYEVSLEDTFK